MTAWLAAVLAAAAFAPPPANARFDYQIGDPYPPPRGVRVVSRDWAEGKPPRHGYAVCYVNAFQTQPDAQWPADLVLRELGDDPNWGGEYLLDISTRAKRRRIAALLQPMIETCARKGFVRQRLSAYAYPRKIEFVDELPKTLTGKIRRIELRQAELEAAKGE